MIIAYTLRGVTLIYLIYQIFEFGKNLKRLKRLKRCKMVDSIGKKFSKWVYEDHDNIPQVCYRTKLYCTWDVNKFIYDLNGPTTFEEVLKELEGNQDD